MKFRAQRVNQRLIPRLHLAAGRAHAADRGHNLRKRHQILKGRGMFRFFAALGPVGKGQHPMIHAHGHAPPAHRADVSEFFRFLRVQVHAAVAVSVKVILALLRKEFDCACNAAVCALLQRAFERRIGNFALNEVHLAAQLGRRMRVRIGNQREPVQLGQPPVHGRVGGQAGFQRVDMLCQVAEAGFDFVEAGHGSEQRKMRRPDMRRNEHCLRAGIQRDFQKIVRAQAQNGPPVRVDIADGLQPFGKGRRPFEGRKQNDRVHLAHPTVLFVDAADLAAEHEFCFLRLRRLKGIGHPVFVPQRIHALARLAQLLRKHLPPRRVREVAGANQRYALAFCPQIQHGGHAVSAGSSGILGMDVQIRRVHIFSPIPARSAHSHERQAA